MSDKKLQDRKRRARAMMRVLRKTFADRKARTALHYKTPWQLLVAVVLSAQCTDARVNEVTKTLFKKYTTINDYASARLSVFEKDIRSTGFYKNKAKHIIGAAKMIRDTFGGRVPRSMDELIQLPGVARKTANVVLSDAFGVIEGMAVDTHVRRFATRFNLSDSRDPKKIEQDLMQLLPKKDWPAFSNLLIDYGREICPARRHNCKNHPLTRLYPQAASCWPSAK
jgi:endonuclease III